uniref:Uncharacterized protein MANES_04G135600 n=1 Tax=Rhizophora mucronata TaxID=61149 RepID=A0A2P2JDC9_RHIMU
MDHIMHLTAYYHPIMKTILSEILKERTHC